MGVRLVMSGAALTLVSETPIVPLLQHLVVRQKSAWIPHYADALQIAVTEHLNCARELPAKSL